MNDRQKAVLVRAINHFGVEANIDKALEEMGELTTELSRRRLARYDKEKVAEEIGDVLVTVEKLRIIFGGSRVDGYIEKKLAALEREMGGCAGDCCISARAGSLVGECIGAGLMAGLKSLDPDLAKKVQEAPAVFIPGNDIWERVAAFAKKRRTNDGDPVEAAFHGEVWCRCRLCGKTYEQQSEVKGNLPGERYCPWCNGYGKEDRSHE